MKNNILFLGLGALAVYLLSQNGGFNFGVSTTQKRESILNLTASTGTVDERLRNIFLNLMTDSEVNIVYNVLFNYIERNRPVPQNLQTQMQVISGKYNIFT